MSTPISSEQTRAINAEKALDVTLQAAETRAAEFLRLAQVQRRRFSTARTFAVFLGVLTPTLVAFQTQRTEIKWLPVVAILLTAGTGIVSGLQAAFKWGEGYARNLTSAQQLDELLGAIKMESEIFRTTTDYQIKYDQMKRLQERTWQQVQQIVRSQIQAELADVSDSPKAYALTSSVK